MSAAFRGGFYPFWFWNDRLDPREIRRQIREMARGGVLGFFIHCRQGLTTPYLSDSFFDAVGAAIAEASTCGLTVHLYDEYPYPSGVAGGEVVLGSPEVQATSLEHRWIDHDGGPVRIVLPVGRVLACTAFPTDGTEVDWANGKDLRSSVGMVLSEESYVETGLTQYNRKRYFASAPVPVLETELGARPWKILAAVQQQVTHNKYWGAYADVLNPDAVRRFISCTHERYYERFADSFGTVIKSVFVDETAPTWSRLLPPAYERRYGKPLGEDLPALLGVDHPLHAQIRSDFEHLRYELFVEAFERPMSRWCDEHGILYAGEKPSYRLSQLDYMGVPGCEPGHVKAGAPLDINGPSTRQNARATASAAYLYNKEASLCECYHSIGWSGTMQDARLIADGLLMMGISHLVPHGFFYTTHGLKKHDAPPSFFVQMPYWRHWAVLSERVEKIMQLQADTWIDAKVLIVDPEPHVVDTPCRESYEQVLNALLAAHLDYLIVDVDVLQAANTEDRCVRIREIAATVVVVPRVLAPEQELTDALARLVDAGVLIVHVGVDFDEEKLVAAVTARAAAGLPARVVTGSVSHRRLHLVTRTNGFSHIHFLLNTEDAVVGVEIPYEEPLEELPIEPFARALLGRTNGRYTRVFQPFELVVLRSGGHAVRSADGPIEAPTVLRLGGPAVVKPLEANLLRLSSWSMQLIDEDGSVLQEAEVRAIPIANQLRDGGFRFVPDMQLYFGHSPEMGFPKLHVRYSARVENEWDGAVELVMEPESLRGTWSISVNEGTPFTAADFQPTKAHVPGSLASDVGPLLRRGMNTITVDLITDHADGGLRNPLYLAGDFGVDASHRRLSARSEAGRFEAYAANGLPYYAGRVEYRFTGVRLEGDRTGDDTVAVLVTFDEPFEEAMEISLNGGPLHLVPWSPYRLVCSKNELKGTANEVMVRVYTSLIRSFEGQEFDRVDHRYRDIG